MANVHRGRTAAYRPEPGWWTELGSGYLLAVVRRGGRPNTRRAYSYELHDFGNWLQRAGVGTMLDMNRLHIEEWQDDMQDRKAPRTQKLAASAVRGALRWAADHDLPLSNPSLWLRVEQRSAPPLKPKPIPRLALEAIKAHLETLSLSDKLPSLLELRTRALFATILSSGARISEALSLTRTSVVDGTAEIIQKGGSEHTLVFSDLTVAAMHDYLQARTDCGPSLFVSHGEYRPLEQLGKQEAQRAWNHLCLEVGIPRFTSHQIRHTCATEMLRLGFDSLIVAKHLGHRGLSSIAGYAEVGLDSRRQAMVALDGRLAS